MLAHLVGGRTDMRKVMVFLMVLVLAQLAKTETVTLTIAPGSTMSETYFAHHEANLLPYSKEYEKRFKKLNNINDFTKMKPGDYLFECQPKAEGVVDEPKSEPTKEAVPEIRKYESSGLINFNQYEKVEWTPETQRPEPASTLENSVGAKVSAQMITRTKPAQETELLMPIEKPEAFTVKAEEKIADQNRTAYKRLNKKSYPRESFLSANIPYLLIGGALLITIILSIISVRHLLIKLSKYVDPFRARGPSPREVELKAQVEELEKELDQYKKHLFLFNYPGLKRRSDLKLLKELAFQVRGQTPERIPLVFIPGLDELVPARPLIIESALRRAQENLGDKCAYIIPERRASVKETTKPGKPSNLHSFRKPAARAATS